MPKPKGKRRQKGTDKFKAAELLNDDDTVSVNDNGSVTSSVSENRSIYEDGGGGCGGAVDQEVDSQLEHENFEDKLKDAIDGLTQKSAAGRKQCLESIVKAFTSRYIYDFVIDRRETIAGGVEHCLRKGKGDEQELAAHVVALLCIQLGAVPESDAIFKELKQTLITLANDKTVSGPARAACLRMLSLGVFITDVGQEYLQEILVLLESTFSDSYLKGDGIVPSHSPQLLTIHNAALSAWSLLLTLLSPSHVQDILEAVLYRLPELLQSSDVDLRIIAGDTIAVIYEIMRERDEDFEGDDIYELCTQLKELATDSHKFRAKKERKQQRSSFRDILKFVEDNAPPCIQIRFGREVLDINSWCRKRQYDAFCQTLSSGMNLHLTENILLRDIFELGPPLVVNNAAVQKASKFERHMFNVATFRARTVAMNKVRDKRTIIF